LSPEDIEKNQNLFKNCSYCLISTEIPEPCIKKVIEIAKINNSKIILKPSSRKEVSNEILKEVEILVLNKTEFKLLSKNKKNIDEGGQYFLKNCVKNIIITSIKDGYTFINEEKIKKFSPINFPSLDITGSSDIFIATLASYLTKNFKLENSIEIAIYAAAFSTLHQGPSNGLMDRTSLEAYIEKVNPDLLKI
ncbi:PfkB family carbohydrate kinase, partial [Fusobacterium sp.]|uniref:PfkB family carbohydrate kinase n=1 Tax=Fusobacterium sp. TaxID=68766 RepID=UPI00262A97D2